MSFISGVKIGGEKFIALRSDKIEKNGPDAIYTTIVRKGNNGASIARVKNCKSISETTCHI